MSRLSGTDTIVVRPKMDIYTVMTAVATVAVIVGLVLIYIRAEALFDGGLLGGEKQPTPARSTR